MISAGYARVSNAYGMISRIDREDWREHMAQQHSPNNVEFGRKWVKCLGAYAADHYRRIYSNDKMELGRTKGRNFPSSQDGPTEYLRKVY